MIVVRVELWSANTGKKTELARMHICNDGTSAGTRHSYFARVFRGRSTPALDRGHIHRQAELKDWPREQLHVWFLVCAMLKALGYQRAEPITIDQVRAEQGVRNDG